MIYIYKGPFNFAGTYVCYLYKLDEKEEIIGRTEGKNKEEVKNNADLIVEALKERWDRLG